MKAAQFVRFAGLLAVVAVVLIITLLQALKTPLRMALLVLLLLGACGQLLPEWIQMGSIRQQGRLFPPLAKAISLRDMALELRPVCEGPSSAAVVMAGFESLHLQFFGDMRVIESLYWENRAGQHAATDFFADYGDRDAEQIARARGIEYVIADTRPQTAAQWHYCKYGDEDPAGIKRTLAYRLATGSNVPGWLIPAPPNIVPLTMRSGFRIYAVVWK